MRARAARQAADVYCECFDSRQLYDSRAARYIVTTRAVPPVRYGAQMSRILSLCTTHCFADTAGRWQSALYTCRDPHAHNLLATCTRVAARHQCSACRAFPAGSASVAEGIRRIFAMVCPMCIAAGLSQAAVPLATAVGSALAAKTALHHKRAATAASKHSKQPAGSLSASAPAKRGPLRAPAQLSLEPETRSNAQ